MKIFAMTTSRLSLHCVKVVGVLLSLTCPLVHAGTTGTLSGPITILIDGTNIVQAGDTFQWTLTLVNQSDGVRTNISQFTVYSFADFWDGSASDEPVVYNPVESQVSTNIMSAWQTNLQQITLTPPSYTGLLSTADSFRCEAVIQTDGPSEDVWAGEMITLIQTPHPNNFLTITPSNVVTTGTTVNAMVVYTNIAPFDLHEFNAYISFPPTFATSGLLQTHEFSLGTVTQSQCIVVLTNAVAVSQGTNVVSATIEAEELGSVCEQLNVTVHDP